VRINWFFSAEVKSIVVFLACSPHVGLLVRSATTHKTTVWTATAVETSELVLLSACRTWGTSSLRRRAGDLWLRAGETLRLPSCARIRLCKFHLKCGAFRPGLKIWFNGYCFPSN
jgi:hypothetical protein